MGNPTLKRCLPYLAFAVMLAAAIGALFHGALFHDNHVMEKAMDLFRVPVVFEANIGQAESSVRFLGRGDGYIALFEPRKVTIAKAGAMGGKPDLIVFSFPDASASHVVEGVNCLAGRSNYFVGDDPSKWVLGAPHYEKVAYRKIYPGIDLIFYSKNGNLEFDFVVSPGADPGKIRLALEGASVKTDGRGNLLLEGGASGLTLLSPAIYQETGGHKVLVQGGFAMEGRGKVGFEVASYDKGKPLIIDPVLLVSTFLGGASNEEGRDIAVDSSGNILLTGFSLSTNFPGGPVFSGGVDFGDVFAIKMNPSGSAVIYSTFIGGASDEAGNAITTDSRGNAYMAGFTSSSDFPVFAPFQGSLRGGRDAFVVKLDPNGLISLSTFLGGGANDEANDLVVDGGQNVFIAGLTASADFPILNSSRTAPDAGGDAFVTMLKADGQSLGYSVLIGGNNSDEGSGIALDSEGNAYLTGSTLSSDFPVVAPFQGTLAGGKDAFAAKLDPSGAFLYSTFLGGGASDNGAAIEVDEAGAAFITGSTNSIDFPVRLPLRAFSGATDAFVAKLSPAGNAIVFSTFFGGAGVDEGNALAFLSGNSVYLAGRTESVDLPVVDQFQQNQPGDDAFVAKIAPAFPSIVYSSYLGGGADDVGLGLIVNSSGQAYISGKTNSASGFPTPGAFDPTYNGAVDAFAAKIANTPNAPPPAPQLVIPDNNSTVGGTTVSFRWKRSSDPDGDPVVYELLVCADPQFKGCTPVRVASSASAASKTARALFAPFAFAAGIVLFGAKRAKRLLFAGVLALLAAFLLSCGGGGGGPGGGVPLDEVEQTVPGLDPGTTYFWKVAVFDDMGGIAESATRSFSTP